MILLMIFGKGLTPEDEESEYRMTRHQDEKSNDNVENDTFCFLQFLFITARNEYEPTSIDDENHTDDGEEGVQVIENTSDNSDTFIEILILDDTVARPEKFGFFTAWASINRRNKGAGKLDEKESDNRVNNDIFSLLQFLFITTTSDNREKCIDHHHEKSHTSKQLKKTHNRRKNIDPYLPSEHRADNRSRISNKKRVPYGESNLHDENSYRNPDDICSPFLDTFLIS